MTGTPELNIWLTAEEEHATVKIYALSGVKHSTVEKDETIKKSNDGKTASTGKSICRTRKKRRRSGEVKAETATRDY